MRSQTGRRTILARVVGALGLVAIVTGAMSAASAAPRGLPSITLRAPDPASYSSATGGGTWGDGRGLMSSLAPRPVGCGAVVSFLVAIDAPVDAVAGDLRIVVGMSPEMTGQPGAGLVPVPGGVTIDAGDPGQRHDGGSRIAEVIHVPAPDPAAGGALSMTTVIVTDVEAGERVIVRMDTRVVCRSGAAPTGVLHFVIDTAALNGEVVPVGRQTIPVKIDATTTTTTSTTTTTTSTTTTTTSTTTTTTTLPPSTSTTGGGVSGSTSTTLATGVLSDGGSSAASCNTGAAGASVSTSTTVATPGATLAAEVCGDKAVRGALASTGSRTAPMLVALGLALLAIGLVGARLGTGPERRLR